MLKKFEINLNIVKFYNKVLMCILILCLFSIYVITYRDNSISRENYVWQLGQLNREVERAEVELNKLKQGEDNYEDMMLWLNISMARIDTLINGLFRKEVFKDPDTSINFDLIYNELRNIYNYFNNNNNKNTYAYFFNNNNIEIAKHVKEITSLSIYILQNENKNKSEIRFKVFVFMCSVFMVLILLHLIEFKLMKLLNKKSLLEYEKIKDKTINYTSINSNILLNSLISYFLIDKNGFIIETGNPMKFSFSYWIGKNFFSEVNKLGYDSFPQLKEIYEETKRFKEWSGSLIIIDKEKNKKYYHLKVTICNSSFEETYHWLMTDVTEYEYERQKNRTNARFAMIGEISSHLAHELTQPINIILMSAENLIRNLKNKNSDIEYIQNKVQKIINQSSRCNSIINKIRQIGKNEQVNLYLFDVYDPLISAINNLSEIINTKNIEIMSYINENEYFIYGDNNKTGQVLFNILLNSIHQFDYKKTSNPFICIRAVTDSETTIITIEDNGGGICIEPINKVFEPFFTTKDFTSGSGLGLSICRTFMEEQQGTIKIENTDHGALISIIFRR